MYKEGKEYYILVPRKFVKDDFPDQDLRTGILMAFCWITRFGTQDGYYTNSLYKISVQMGLHYNKDKDRHIPVAMTNFKNGIEYLCEQGSLEIIRGDNNNFEEEVIYKLDTDFYMKEPYILLNVTYFDYILGSEKRTRKAYLLYVALFILSCYTVKDGKSYCCCSYSIDYLIEALKLTPMTLYRYLKTLADEKTVTDSNKPFVKSKGFYVKTKNGRMLKFTSIYVENKPNALEIIGYQRSYIRNHFLAKEIDVPQEFLESDEYYELY